MNENKYSIVLELCLKCPFGRVQRNCPMEHLRLVSRERRISLLAGMMEAQLDGIIDYHAECMNVRMSLAS